MYMHTFNRFLITAFPSSLLGSDFDKGAGMVGTETPKGSNTVCQHFCRAGGRLSSVGGRVSTTPQFISTRPLSLPLQHRYFQACTCRFRSQVPREDSLILVVPRSPCTTFSLDLGLNSPEEITNKHNRA